MSVDASGLVRVTITACAPLPTFSTGTIDAMELANSGGSENNPVAARGPPLVLPYARPEKCTYTFVEPTAAVV